LIDIAFNIVEALLERDLIAGLFFALSHFEAAAVFKLDGFPIGSEIAMTNMMRTT
jgi:hypothetical protein